MLRLKNFSALTLAFSPFSTATQRTKHDNYTMLILTFISLQINNLYFSPRSASRYHKTGPVHDKRQNPHPKSRLATLSALSIHPKIIIVHVNISGKHPIHCEIRSLAKLNHH